MCFNSMLFFLFYFFETQENKKQQEKKNVRIRSIKSDKKLCSVYKSWFDLEEKISSEMIWIPFTILSLFLFLFTLFRFVVIFCN